MNMQLITGIGIGVAVSVVLVVSVVAPLLKKKGVNTSQVLEQTETVISTAKDVANVVSKIVPMPYINTVKEVINIAQVGVQKSEQLFKISQLAKDDRKQAAVQFTYDTLKMANIEITPELASVVDGAVEAAVLLLPKSE